MSELQQHLTGSQGEARDEGFADIHINRQQAAVDAMTGVLLDAAMSPDEQQEAIGQIRVEAGCTTLEGRTLHFFAINRARQARVAS